MKDCEEPCATVELERVGTLGSPDDPSLFTMVTSYAVFGDGHIAAGDTGTPGVVAIYDAQRGFERLIGREGGGPGEFRSTRVYPGPGGRVWVFDSNNSRIHILEPGGEIGATPYMGGSIEDAAVFDSVVVVSGYVDLEHGWEAHVLSMFDGEGHVVRSFGPPYSAFPRTTLPSLAGTSHGTVFIAPGNAYHVEEWSLAGELLRVFERRVDWFEPWTMEEVWAGLNVYAFLYDIAVDADGRLWCFLAVPSGAPPAPPGADDEDPLEKARRERDVMIEVIDPESARVVARRRFPELSAGPLEGSSLISSIRQTEDGYIYQDLWRAAVRPRS